MAGDWIKMRMDLPEDPAVFKLTRLTGLDRYSVVGRLYAFWAWADKHAVDGRVDHATSTDLDDVVAHEGFAEAMQEVRWLVIGDDYLCIPKHDRHNGESAKERSLKNARQARWRAGKDSDVDAAPSTSPSEEPSTREEKRREEKNSSSLRSEEQRASRLPKPFELPDDWRAFCQSERPDLDPDRVAAKFADFWHGKPGAGGKKLDWLATWRNWVREERAGTRAFQTVNKQSGNRHSAAAAAFFPQPTHQGEVIDV